ncbi:hypothetical protein CEXT_659131 [Caerostris extrusa]|uniref:Uncharacterized protein n=1 Tax=Caerostris extrusa TaxID=172846 RepID=A0AAV4RF28_CAEEX|nr:hypothetical protein CEXT_659131 [Caerostris extrusa]
MSDEGQENLPKSRLSQKKVGEHCWKNRKLKALEYCLDVGNINLSAIRTIRVLRPLRAINRIPSMRIPSNAASRYASNAGERSTLVLFCVLHFWHSGGAVVGRPSTTTVLYRTS